MKRFNGEGFILPVILVALLIMSTLALAAMITSGDEQRSNEAMHESSVVFYAAEAGVEELWGSWDTTRDSLVSLLSPGDTLDLDWHDLAGGAKYHGLVIRTDDASGSDPSYILQVEGRGPGPRGGRRVLAVALEGGAGSGGPPPGGYTLGECCHSAATARGEMALSGSSFISGYDSIPPGWDDGRCDDYVPEDVAGLTYTDGSDLDAETTGDPPLVYDPSLSDASFNEFGELDWEGLAAMATTHLYNPEGSQKGLKYGGDPAPAGCSTNPITSGSSDGCYIGPRYNPDGTCDTSHPLNFGAKTGPCKDYYPVVLVTGDFAFRGDGAAGGYAQGIFVMDTTAGGIGSEFDIEKGGDFTVAGIMIGKGCFEMDSDGPFRWYGAVFSDGFVNERASCDTDQPLYLHGGTGIQYSQCAVQRTLLYSGVGDSVNGGPPGGGGVSLISSRAMREILR